MLCSIVAGLICCASGTVLGQEPITVKVLSCYDGDTCRLEREVLPGRDRMRLANADTPEIEGRCQEEIDRAVMARDYTHTLVAGKVVTLSAIEPDKFRKRIDAYLDRRSQHGSMC
jgi:endonuclease YncB( thermonuclease family)